MMKYLFTAAVAMASASALFATPLTPDQALQRLSGNTSLKAASRSAASLKLVHTVTAQSGTPAMYVFNFPTDKGYVILSADDVAAPMLGYADNGSFELSEMPPQMEWWLSQYADEIAYASSSAAYTTRTETRAAIAPLMKTTWNQTAPYNNLCPVYGGTVCPTGCVATAMAQVMKYWNYPAKGTGTGTATLPTGATGDATMNLSTTSFDWTNMLNSYAGTDYTSDQATAVATLMKAAGYASGMSYTADSSGALALNAAKAFYTNFSYNENIQYLQRKYFKASDWESIVYNELASGRPVMYGGQSLTVGHEFVCDGYDGNGYYHFNWGWGGLSDGYFLLNALNPDSVGTGGGGGGGYNSGQDIIVGVQPDAENVPVYVTQYGSLSAALSGVNINLTINYGGSNGYWLNTGINDMTVNIAAQFQPVDGGTATYQTISSNATAQGMNINGNQVGYYYFAQSPITMMLPSDLADGKYKVTICSQNAKYADSEWLPVCTTEGAYNYFYLTKNGSDYSVENMTEVELTINSAQITTSLYYGNAFKIKMTVTNNSELEMTGGFFPVLLSGSNPVMVAEGVSETFQPGETKELEFSSVFELLSSASAPTTTTTYTLRFLTDASGSAYYNYASSATMKILSDTPSLSVSDFTVIGSTAKTMLVGTKMYNVNVTSNAAEIPFTATIKNNGSFFAYQIYNLIFNADLAGYNLTLVEMGPTPILNALESAVVTGTLDFSEATMNTPYAAALFYYNGSGFTQFTNPIYFAVDPTTGVNDIEAESEYVAYDKASNTVTACGAYVSLEVYDLNGMKLAETQGNGNDTLSVQISGSNGIAVAVARKANGETKTLKVTL